MRVHEWFQADAAGLFFALNHQRDGAGRTARNFVPRAERFKEHHHLPLVIHGAARNDALAVRAIKQLWIKWRAVPQFNGVRWLHVVMTVEEDARCAASARPWMRGKHHRVADGRHACSIESHAAQVAHQPFRRVRHISGVRWIGRDAGDA